MRGLRVKYFLGILNVLGELHCLKFLFPFFLKESRKECVFFNLYMVSGLSSG